MSKRETMEVTVDGHIATVTLNRPELLNRVDAALHRELLEVFDEFRAGTDARVLILASTGSTFSAGGDVNWIRGFHDDVVGRLRALDEGRRLLNALLDVPIPVIAAVQGDAYGLGATVIAGCDAVVASRTAGLADSHVAIGLVAGDGGCVLWPQAVGIVRAKRYLLTGDRLSAQQAFDIGLVTDLVDGPDDVLPAARKIADRLAALPPLAVQGTKRSLNTGLAQRAAAVFDASMAQEALTFGTDDFIEALDAFLERRPGEFQGR